MHQKMTNLPNLAAFEVSGRDALRFLHNQVSANLQELETGEARFACLCAPNGRVEALLAVCRQTDSLLVLCPAIRIDGLVARLSRFILRDDVLIRQLASTRIVGLADATDPVGLTADFEPLDGLHYGIVAGDADKADPGAPPATAWKAAEMARGVVWLNPATSGQFLPQMLGYEKIGALSFNKGCYPGQEIIARIRYLGRLKQHPLKLIADTGEAFSELADVTLVRGAHRVDAQVVDQVGLEPGRSGLFLVMRTEGAFEPEQLVWGDQSAAVRPWLQAGASQACATT